MQIGFLRENTNENGNVCERAMREGWTNAYCPQTNAQESIRGTDWNAEGLADRQGAFSTRKGKGNTKGTNHGVNLCTDTTDRPGMGRIVTPHLMHCINIRRL
jgi:hypothetical protein